MSSAICGCSGGDTAPGSAVDQPKAGSGGSGGEAGSLSLGVSGGGTGGGGTAGAAGSAGAGVAGASGGVTGQGGSAGGSSSGGSSNGGSGGSKPAGTCKRATGSDADCRDFDGTTPQAYTCDDASAYVMLNGTHDDACYSVNFITGAKYGACCPP